MISSLPPDGPDDAVLEGTEQLDLQGLRHLGDLVEQEGAPLGLHEEAPSLPVGAGEGSPLVAEQLGFQQRLGNGRTVDGDEPAFAPAAVPVDGPRHQLLARAAVTQQQHRGVGVRDHPDLLEHALHGLRPAEDVVEAVAALDLGPEPPILLTKLLVLHGPLDDQRQLRKLERLGQVVVRALAHGVDRALEAPERGHEDHPRPRLDALGLSQHGQAVHRLHDEVGQHDRVLLAPQRGLGVLTSGHGRHRPAFHLEMTTEKRHHVGIVVHDEDSGFHDCSFLSLGPVFRSGLWKPDGEGGALAGRARHA